VSLVLTAIPRALSLENHIVAFAGGGPGIFRNTLSEGAVVATAPVSLTVEVGTFRGIVNSRLAYLGTAATSEAVAAPTGGSSGDLRRKDTVQYVFGEGISIKTGSESATPSAPAADTGALKLAEIHCRNGMASIKDADDASNGFIVDARTFF